MNKTMLLVTSSWGPKKTFKLLPSDLNCPYNEAIYDADSRVLAVISKQSKDSLHMVAKLNEWGDPLMMKIGKRQNGKDYAEERKTLNTFYEYYIEEPKEIENFINMFAINADTYDFSQYVNAEVETPKTGNLLTAL
jgi:hypothetical protein